MTPPGRANTNKWNDNSVVLIESRFSQIHRRMVLKRSRFAELIQDRTDKILDLGCGSGPFLQYFKDRGFQNVYAIEPDRELIKNVPPGLAVEIKNCRAEGIEFETGMFDVVFVYGVLHHLKGVVAYQEACREIMRVLKPGGTVFMMEPGCYPVFRVVEIGSRVLGKVSRTFKAFSDCLEEEVSEQHFFIKNHSVVKDAILAAGGQPVVDRYFGYTWIFTARKPGHKES